MDEEEKGNVARQEKGEEVVKEHESIEELEKLIEEEDIKLDTDGEPIKNNFIYLNFSLIYIKK